jgi:hypothetical protein
LQLGRCRTIGLSVTSLHLASWTHAAVHAECRDAYNRYSRGLDAHYRDYFRSHLDEGGPHPRQAADIERALPLGWEHLADDLPERARHVHHLSGRSSQVLALALLGASGRLDPGLAWLFEALSPLPPSDSPSVSPRFEHELPPEALNEQLPRVTSIDFLVQTSEFVICTEAKRGEDGMGRCSCPPGAPKIADCSQKVLDRPLYWRAANHLFGMPARVPGKPCPVNLGYQAIRSVAAARYLATGPRAPVFALVYDAENPYFRGVGAWPGWPAVLEHTLRGQDDQIRFRAVSWRELLPRLPLPDELRAWARVKHRL